MTNLVNQHWINFNGEPVTGRTPPNTTVYGPPMTPQQQGEVAHTYKLFCDANNLALGQYQVRNRTLADGTRIRCTSINGVDQVQVWTGGGEKKDFDYSGYLCGDVDGTKDFINILHPERDLFLHFDVSMKAGTVDWSSAIDTEFDAHRVTYTPGFLRRHYFPGLRACLDYPAIGLAGGEVRLPPAAKKYGDGLSNVFYRGCRIITPHPVIAACRFGNGFLALCFVDDTEVAPDPWLEFYFLPDTAKKIDRKIADTKKLHSLTIDTLSDWQAVGEVGIKPYDDTVILGGSWAFNASGTIAATVGFSLDAVGYDRTVKSHLVQCSITADANGNPVVSEAETSALTNTLSILTKTTEVVGPGGFKNNPYPDQDIWTGSTLVSQSFSPTRRNYVYDGKTLFSNIDFPSTPTHIAVSVDFDSNSIRFLNFSFMLSADDTSWNPLTLNAAFTLGDVGEWGYVSIPSGIETSSFGNKYRIRTALCLSDSASDIGEELVYAETNAEYLEKDTIPYTLQNIGADPTPVANEEGGYPSYNHDLAPYVAGTVSEFIFYGTVETVSVKHLDIRNSFAVFEKTTMSISSPTTGPGGTIDVDNNQSVVAMETFMNGPGESSEIAAKEPELNEYVWPGARSAATTFLNFPYYTFDDYPDDTYLPLIFLDMIAFSDSTLVAAALNRLSRLRRITFDEKTYVDMKHMGETVPIKEKFDAASQELLTPMKVI